MNTTAPTTPAAAGMSAGQLLKKDPRELRALIDSDLVGLARLYPRLTDLLDTRQRGIGFLTPVGRRVMDQQLRREHDARYSNLKDGVEITGDVPAPVNVNIVSLADDIAHTLADTDLRIRRRLSAAGVCPNHKPPAGDPIRVHDLVADLRVLISLIVGKKLLLELHRTTSNLLERTRTAIDGNDRTEHNKPCPWCGRNTLIVYLTAGIIRCEEDRDTGRLEECVCPYSWCDCKTVGTSHEWRREPNTGKSSRCQGDWRDLARAQADAEERTTHPKEPHQ